MSKHPARRCLPRYPSMALALLSGMLLLSEAAEAQEPVEGVSPLDLPRKGYEPKGIKVGTTMIALSADLTALYDTNVYATSSGERDDILFVAAPRIDANSDFGRLQLHSQMHASIRQYVDETTENATSFGLGAGGNYSISRAHSLKANVQYDRAIERRSDPEARGGRLDSPRKIDIPQAEIGYNFEGNRIDIDAEAAVQRFDYRAASDDDRDMTAYRASLGSTLRLSAPLNAFAQVYVTRRDFDTRADISGVDRDATTYGVIAGVRRDLSTKLRGRVGVGVFRMNPADPALSAFTGIAANGEVIWSPQPRTAVTFQVFRGDVATVRAGASGRIDSRATIRLDQEVRHNIVMHAAASYRDTTYRGLSTRNLKTLSGEVGVEYLLNRHMSAFALASYTKRDADLALDQFDRGIVGIGLRLRY